jgi:hypothetical protein
MLGKISVDSTAKKFLFPQVAVSIILFGLFNVSLLYLTKNAPAHRLVRYIETEENHDAVFVGSSIMEAGFDKDGFIGNNSAGIDKPLNIGLGSTHTIEHLVLLKHSIKRNPKLELCVIGTFDFDLMRPSVYPLDGNRLLSYYVEPTTAARLYHPESPVSRAVFPALGKIPVFTERYSVWARVEKLRRSLSDISFVAPDSDKSKEGGDNQFGRAADFQALESKDKEAFRAACILYQSQNFSPAAQELLQTARSTARRTVLVVMPMSPFHRENFYSVPEWAAFREHMRLLAEQNGTEFIDAADWIPTQEGFADNVHLNAKGAKEFSARLAREIGNR